MTAPVPLPQAAPAALDGADGGRRPFGEAFTATMAVADWAESDGWGTLRVTERSPLLIDPAMVGLHYGQIVFEGLKAHRTADGSVAVFRPDAYARRMRRSARRFAMPEPPDELFVAAVAGVTEADQESLPVDDESASLYLRPLLVASEPSLALRPARSYLFVVIAFVTGGFFSDDPEPIQ